MVIRNKKIRNNEYIKTPNYNIWIRNFCNTSSSSIDINSTIKETEYFLFLKNEFQNNIRKYQWADPENYNYTTAVIISDGYDFNKLHNLLEKNKNVCFFGVNNSLKKWNNEKNSLNFYVVNNPYEECLRFLPPKNKKSLPRCIASNRTYPEFLDQYNGLKERYSPVNEESVRFNKPSDVYFQIDDYRNPVCASINLAYRFGCQKIFLLCCDDSFVENKPGSVLLENNLYTYPQQNIASEVIDCCLHWFKKSGGVTGYHSMCKKLQNAEYIKQEDINNYIIT
jgi:hypothetical protein